ncbi:Uncharacterised protein [Mycobacteroides abscessus subsp. abscessus]|nr:Uncharacterised protein [Mycobacteroides abscessus subsp. abscessus]
MVVSTCGRSDSSEKATAPTRNTPLCPSAAKSTAESSAPNPNTKRMSTRLLTNQPGRLSPSMFFSSLVSVAKVAITIILG